MGTEVFFRFEHDDLAPAHRELPRDGKAHDARADDCAIDFFCHWTTFGVAAAGARPTPPAEFLEKGTLSMDWDPGFVERSPMFGPLATYGARLRSRYGRCPVSSS